jgi:hypothetical protein
MADAQRFSEGVFHILVHRAIATRSPATHHAGSGATRARTSHHAITERVVWIGRRLGLGICDASNSQGENCQYDDCANCENFFI